MIYKERSKIETKEKKIETIIRLLKIKQISVINNSNNLDVKYLDNGIDFKY